MGREHVVSDSTQDTWGKNTVLWTVHRIHRGREHVVSDSTQDTVDMTVEDKSKACHAAPVDMVTLRPRPG